MTVHRFLCPDESPAFSLLIDELNSTGSVFSQTNRFDLDPPEIVICTGDDAAATTGPASVYLGQLQRALDQLGYRAEFDAALASASASVQAWANSGGELLVNSVNFASLIPVDRRDIVFRLAARL